MKKIKKRASLFLLIFSWAFIFAMGMASAANCGGEIACSCGDTIIENAVLTENLSCSSRGLTIGEENITIDCDRYRISGRGNDYGIYNPGYYNITVKNCVISRFNSGIFFLNGRGANISNNDISWNNININFEGFSLSSVSNNTLNYATDRAVLYNGYSALVYNNTMVNNIASYNNQWGLNLLYNVQNNEFENNTFCFNGDVDISIYDDKNNSFGSNTFDTSDGLNQPSLLTKSNSCVLPEFDQGGCGQSVKSNLTLTEDIVGCLGNGLKISADNITINCNGHTIGGIDQYTSGILNSGYSNISIANCNISDFEHGIRTYSTGRAIENFIIDNSTFYDNYYGIYFQETIKSNVTNSIFDSNSYAGIQVYYYSSGNNFLRNNYTNNNYGLYLDNEADNNSILDSRFISNNYGFYLNYADNNNIGRNFVDSTSYNFGEPSGSSCPFLYSWNGTSYTFISDMSTEGKLSLKKLYPDDYLKVGGSQLKPVNNRYNLQVTEEYDEISFIDELKLFTIDHSPQVDVFNGLTRLDAHTIYTVSKNPSQVESCIDSQGNNCLSQVSKEDGVFTMHPVDNITNMVTLDLGNLTNASEIKLIISYAWANGYMVSNYKKSVQIKDARGNWTSILSDSDLTTRAALQKTYVLNLTNRFLTNNYSLRLILPIQSIDYIALDTTPEQEISINEYEPISANLHYRGYSDFVTNITKMFFYNNLINQDFSTPTGNFTRYGDVSSLVNSTDDKYAIISHGDEISVSFPYEQIPEGQERDFLMFEYAYYKPASLDIGKAVEPLPFGAMTSYPYSLNESYPSSEEYQTYLEEYNTRAILPKKYGGSLPYSINNTVFDNTIIAAEGSYGLYLQGEIDTQILNNNISGSGYGINLDSSSGTFIRGNNVTTVQQALRLVTTSTLNSIESNIFSSSGDRCVYIEDGSSSNTLLHNTIRGDQWVADWDGNNFYNDSYSGNIYYFADGTNSWEGLNLTDLNNDGWAEGGMDLPFNKSTHSSFLVNTLSYPDSLANNGGWLDFTPVYDQDLTTGDVLNATASSAEMYYGFNPSSGTIFRELIIGTDLGLYNLSIPDNCIVPDSNFGVVSIAANLTASPAGLNVWCYNTSDMWTYPGEKVLLIHIGGVSTFNGSQISWDVPAYYPWLEGGADWHPAITNDSSIRSINVSLISPMSNFNATSGSISFKYNVTTDWGEENISYCNLTATNNLLRTSEISPVNEAGLVGLWHFNNNLLDSSGNGNNGEAINDARFSSNSIFGSGAELLDGTDDYVNISDSSSLDSTEMTVSAWVKYAGSDGQINWNRIISKKTAWTDNDGFEITMVLGSDSEIYAAGSGDNPNVQVSCVDSWTNNSWHHVAVVYKGSSVNIYCDGSFKGSGAINPIVANNRPLLFGGMQDKYFDGILDEVGIWNRSLSTDEIAALYYLQYANSSSSITKEINQTLSLNLSGGVYAWSISCTDDMGVTGTSETRSLTFGEQISIVENETIIPQTYSSYSPRTYYSDENLPLAGNNFNLRYNDKIRFVVQSDNHTLTMQNFNSTTARVLIQSTPVTAYLQKGILYEFDLNNDSVNDVMVKYDGMNKTKAIIFIQEIATMENGEDKNNTLINVVEDFGNNLIKSNNWKKTPFLIFVFLIIVFIIWKRRNIKEYFKMRKLQRAVHYRSAFSDI